MEKRICIIFLTFLIVLIPVSMALTYKDSLEVHNYRINKIECSNNYLRILVKSETTKNLLLMFKVFSSQGNTNIFTGQRLNKFNSDYFLVNTNLRCNSLLKVEVNGYADIKSRNKDIEKIIYINYEPGYQFNYKENKIPNSLLPVIETQVTNEYTSYVYLGSELISSKNSRNEELYYIQDSLNSNTIVANGNGNLVSLQDYEPYGNNIELNPYTDNRYKFTGKELDKNSDLYYFGARYYDSGIGRFITNDPVFNPSNSPYVYANNNPIKFIDPDGNDPIAISRLLAIRATADWAKEKYLESLRTQLISSGVSEKFLQTFYPNLYPGNQMDPGLMDFNIDDVVFLGAATVPRKMTRNMATIVGRYINEAWNIMHRIERTSFSEGLGKLINAEIDEYGIRIAFNKRTKSTIFMESEDFTPKNLFFEHQALPEMLGEDSSNLAGGLIIMKEGKISSLNFGKSSLGWRNIEDLETAVRSITPKLRSHGGLADDFSINIVGILDQRNLIGIVYNKNFRRLREDIVPKNKVL